MKHTAVISLGSNLPCGAAIVADAAERLQSVATIDCRSGIFSCPDDTGKGPDYSNEVMQLSTDLGEEGLRQFARGLEAAAGRTPESKRLGIMPLDVDLVIWDGTVLCPYDFSRPYFQHGYRSIKSLLKNPDA